MLELFRKKNTNVFSKEQWFRKKTVQFPVKEKDCIFLHGSGVTNTESQSAFERQYWGDIRLATQQCKSHRFVQYDTFYNPWTDPDLLTQYCNISTFGQQDNFLIRDKLIFTHSMGNLVLAKAIQDGYCDLDTSSRWYTASAPLDGSKVATVLAELCNQVSSFPNWVTLEFCSNGVPEPSYASMIPGTPGLAEVRETVTRKSSGSMCGSSAMGLNSIYSIGLVAVELFANLEPPNDGLVETISCAQANVAYTSSYSQPYYKANINHADGTCRNGDTWFGAQDKKPCSWYGSQV